MVCQVPGDGSTFLGRMGRVRPVAAIACRMPRSAKNQQQEPAPGNTEKPVRKRPAARAPTGAEHDLFKRINELTRHGLSPSSALELLGLLIPWVLSASKEDTDRLKMIDKFLNTARGLMETRVKTDEAQLIAARLDELEKRMESIMSAQSRHQSTPIEVWHE
ncbi:MAG: hypothetical protein WCG29_11735 [Desulfomonile sp.]